MVLECGSLGVNDNDYNVHIQPHFYNKFFLTKLKAGGGGGGGGGVESIVYPPRVVTKVGNSSLEED